MDKLIALLLLWWPLLVSGHSWYPAAVQADGMTQQYQPLAKANKIWRICALLPHGKDHYWWGVAWGLSEEASRLGVMLGIYEAGGYDQPDKQRLQLQQCRKRRTPILSPPLLPMVLVRNCNSWQPQEFR